MRVAIVHQNMPGQFLHLARALVREPGNQVVFVTKRADRALAGVAKVTYTLAREPLPPTHQYLRGFEEHILHGQAVLRAFQGMLAQGFTPDIIVGHPGWGELLFLKDLLPNVPLLAYAEYFYSGEPDPRDAVTFQPLSIDARARRRIQESHLLTSLTAADRCLSPTEWQKSTHPAAIRAKTEVIFEGVNVEEVAPDPQARLELADGRVLTPQDEVLTYVSRGLEPMRGFPQFIRALPKLLEARPDLTVLIAGEDQPHYGSPPPQHGTWREAMLKEIPLDPDRVRFLGWLERQSYLKLLQVSTVHVYLTMPFALSWSLFEAMAAECFVVASDVGPVRELVTEGVTGRLTSLSDVNAIASSLFQALSQAREVGPIRRAARRRIVERYQHAHGVERQLRLVRKTAEMGAAFGEVSRPVGRG